MATKSQEILLKGNTTNASAVPSSLKVREIAINALDRSLFTNDGNNIVKLYTGTTKWFDVNGNANNALKLGGILASEYINKEAFNSHINNSTIHITAAERTAWNNKWDYNEETIKGVKVNAAVTADYASSAGDADKLDGVHYQNILERQKSGYRNYETTTGWFRIAESLTADNIGITFLLAIQRSYNNTTNESYLFSISISYRGGISITQLSGYALTRLITKIRVDWVGSQIAYVDLYIASASGNAYSWYTVGCAKSYTEWTANPTLVGTAYEFTTVNGCKSDRGFTGDLVGNSSSATKLQTPRTLWGQSFDGSANVSGDLEDVGNITASGKATIQGDIISGGEVAAIVGEGTPAGVTDYSALTGKPQINGVTLVSGNNTLASLGIQPAGDYITESLVNTKLDNYTTKTFVSNNYVGKSAFNSHTADTNIHITAAERTAWNKKWDYDEEMIKAVKVTSASSADSVAWSGITGKPTTFTPSAHTHTASEISGLPTKLSAFNNDVGYITGITKPMVEGVLTGNITSHTHSYLPLSGGTLTGTLVCNYDLSNSSYYTWRNSRQHSGGGGRSDPFILLQKADGTFNASFGTFGGGETDSFIFIGYGQNYDGLNLRISPTSIYWGNNSILHAGNFNSYAPTLTGTGASGTWGISITGNAATATKLATPRTIWGQNFDGNGDILYTAIPTMTYVLFNKDTSTSIGYIGKGGSADHLYFGGYDGVPVTLFSNDKRLSNNLTVATTGNVLIGTTTDNGYKLQVNGSERVYGDLIVDGEVSALVA